jgi:hypothetical protein
MAYYRSYICDDGHRTNSDFGNSANFEKLQKKKLLSCGCCGSSKVEVEFAAPRVNSGAQPARRQSRNGRWVLVREPGPVLDVGDGFVEAARAMERGDVPHVNIAGHTTESGARALAKEIGAEYTPPRAKPAKKAKGRRLNA